METKKKSESAERIHFLKKVHMSAGKSQLLLEGHRLTLEKLVLLEKMKVG